MLSQGKISLIVSSAVLFVSSFHAFADARNLSLDESVNLALSNNPAIVSSAADREQAKWRLSETRRSRGLSLAFTSAANRIGGKDYESARAAHDAYPSEYPAYQKHFSNQITATIPIYTGGNLENTQEAASHGLSAADLYLENTRQNVRYQTKTAYFFILQRKNNIAVATEAVRNLEEHLKTVSIQYSVGTTPRSDILSTDVHLANKKRTLLAAKNSYEDAVSNLKNIVGIPQNINIEVDDELEKYTETIDMTLDECLAYAKEHRSDNLAIKFSKKQALNQINAAKSGNLPQVNANVSRNLSGEKPFKEDHSGSWTAGLSLSWNLFDSGVTSARVKEAEAALMKVEAQERELQEQIELDVKQAYDDMKSAEEEIEVTKKAVEQAKESLFLAEVRYKEGVDTNIAVMDAQEKLVEIRNSYYEALYNRLTSIAALEKTLGMPVMIDSLNYETLRNKGESSDNAIKHSLIDESKG